MTKRSKSGRKKLVLPLSGGRNLWKTLLRALDTQPISMPGLKGLSGQVHPIYAAGYDHDKKRLLVIAREHSARVVALMQSDIQLKVPDYQVLCMRPMVFNIPKLAKAFFDTTGFDELQLHDDDSEVEEFKVEGAKDVLGPLVDDMLTNYLYAKYDPTEQIVEAFRQMILLDFKVKDKDGRNITWSDLSELEEFDESEKPPLTPYVSIARMAEADLIAKEAEFGICPLPLFEFGEKSLDIIKAGTDLDAIKDILMRHDVYQYFYPPPDQIVLGLADRGINDKESLLKESAKAPGFGHPYGQTDLIKEFRDLSQAIRDLEYEGMVVTTDSTIETTDDGRTVRHIVKARPREGLIRKIVGRTKINLDTRLESFIKVNTK